MKDDYTANSRCTSPYIFSLKGWENALFKPGSERAIHARVFGARVALVPDEVETFLSAQF